MAFHSRGTLTAELGLAEKSPEPAEAGSFCVRKLQDRETTSSATNSLYIDRSLIISSPLPNQPKTQNKYYPELEENQAPICINHRRQGHMILKQTEPPERGGSTV